MKKIILFFIIFLNIFTYVESSPSAVAATVLITRSRSNNYEKVKEKFNILYKNEKDYDYLKYILSNSEKEILVENYNSKEELWNNFLEKYKEKIETMKKEIEFLENASEKEKILFWFFKHRFILLGLISMIVFLSILNFLLKRAIKKEKKNKYCKN
jgi:hypothetical protein